VIAPDTLLSFFGVSVLLALAPGPDNLFVLMQSAAHGRRAGMAVVLGLCTGLIGHTLAVAVGLAALIAASSLAFALLKLVGAAYLLYLAWGAWRAAPDATTPDTPAPDTTTAAPRLSALYRRGIIMNLTNPKVSLFFLAFLPQFVSLAHGSPTLQIITLGAVFMLAALAVFGGIAFFCGLFGERLAASLPARRWLNRCASVVFAGLALRLALART